MKILSIEITGFGKWQQKTIEFFDTNQLLYGCNEAGKSTIYQFVQAMLFGFPAKGKKRKDYTPRNGGSYGGRLWLEHPVHGVVQIERFKEVNRGRARVYMGEQVGGEELLAKLIHPLTKELFQTVFTFQQEQLTQIDQLAEEELQTALLALGISGSNQLLQTRETFQKEAQELFKSKGTRPLLNTALAAHQALSQRIFSKEEEEQRFTSILTELQETQEHMTTQRAAIARIKEQLEAVQKQLSHYSMYAEQQQLQERLAHQDVVQLDAQEQEQLLALFQEYKFLKEERERLTNQFQKNGGDYERSADYLFYLNEEEHIQAFLEKRYEIGKLLSEIDWMTQSLQQNRQEMLGYEQKWHWSEDRPPQLFFQDEQLQHLREQVISRKVQRQTEEEKLRGLQVSIKEQEENLEAFEAGNKTIFQSVQKHQTQTERQLIFLPAAGAMIGIIGSLLVSGSLRWGFLGITLLCLILTGYLLVRTPKKRPQDQVKKQWQQKLSHLDHLNEQYQQTNARLADLHTEEAGFQDFLRQQAVKHHLGNMVRLEDWLNHKEEIKRYLLLVNTNQELRRRIEADQAESQQWLQLSEPFTKCLPLVGKGLAERLTIIARFADEMEQIRFSQENQADIYTKQSLREVREKQHVILETAQPLLYRYQILAIEEVPKKIQQYNQLQAATDRLAELQQLLGDLYSEEASEEQLLQQKNRQAADLATAENELFRLQKEEQRLLYLQRQMLADGTLDQLYQERAELETEIEELATSWSGYRLASQLVIDLLTELSEQQLPSLIVRATEYFQILTNRKYRAIQLIDGHLQLEQVSGQRFAVYELSTGTKDQLIMAIRFAFLSLQEGKNLFPIIIDDGWLHYDKERKRHLARLFKHFGEKQQIICFSSDQEMVSYYQEYKQPVVQLEGEKNEENS